MSSSNPNSGNKVEDIPTSTPNRLNGIEWSFNDTSSLTDSEIQERLKVNFSYGTLEENDVVIMNVPEIRSVNTTYEKFIESKSLSFLTFALHPYFRGKIEVADLKAVNDLCEIRKERETNTQTVSLFGLLGAAFFMNKRKMLEFSPKKKFFLALFTFYAVPRVISEIVDRAIFYPMLQTDTEAITNKYNFSHEAISNPYFRKAYEDILIQRESQRFTRRFVNEDSTNDSNNSDASSQTKSSQDNKEQ